MWTEKARRRSRRARVRKCPDCGAGFVSRAPNQNRILRCSSCQKKRTSDLKNEWGKTKRPKGGSSHAGTPIFRDKEMGEKYLELDAANVCMRCPLLDPCRAVVKRSHLDGRGDPFCWPSSMQHQRFLKEVGSIADLTG